MATTVAAMKGKLGSTEYFILAMKAKELVEKTIIPSEIEGWEDMTLEEKEQRDINYGRVKNLIAPYLASDKDRFFGAIILTAKNMGPSNFEPIADVATKGLPNLYKTQAQLMGFLTFTGGEELIPLDGQHRLKAIKFAIEGKDERSNAIPDITPCSQLANDDVTVILIPYDNEKARKIFTKVNRYAKPTTTGQNLVTDDDDIIAVLSRAIANELITARLVKYKANTLSEKDFYFTTLATVAECNEAILQATFAEKIERAKPIDNEKKHLYQDKVKEIWEYLSQNITLFADMLEDKDEQGDDKRRELRRDYLLGKPVPQACLFKAFSRLTNLESGQGKLTKKEAVDKLNAINWAIAAPEWDRLLISGGKIIKGNARLATDIICYRAGEILNEEQKGSLLDKYRQLFPDDKQDKIALPPLL